MGVPRRVTATSRDSVRQQKSSLPGFSGLLGALPPRYFLLLSGSYKAEFGASTAASLPAQAKVAYARMHALAQSAAATTYDVGTESGSLLLARRSGPSRGERVAFVYADLGLGGSQAFLTGNKQASLRLLDCAVAPDQVEGGGRPDDLVRIFLYGAPCLLLRPMPLQLGAGPGDWSVGEESTAETLEGAVSGGGWLKRWVDRGLPRSKGSGANASGPSFAAFTTMGPTAISAKAQDGAAGSGWGRQAGMTRVVAFFSGESSPLVRAGNGGGELLPFLQYPWQAKPGSKNHADRRKPLLPVYLKYYIVRQVIPAMDRLFGLLPPPACVDLKEWYESMPKPRNSTASWLKYCMGTEPTKSSGGARRGPPDKTSPFAQQPATAATRHTLARHGPPSKRASVGVQKPALPLREKEASSAAAQKQQQQKLLQALRIRSSSGGGSGARLHHFFATSSCLLCGEKCSLLPPGALEACARTCGGPPAGWRARRRERRGRERSRIEFDAEKEDVRATLFEKLEGSSFNARQEKERAATTKDATAVVDLSSPSRALPSASLNCRRQYVLANRLLGRQGEEQTLQQPPPVCSACSARVEGVIVQMYRQLEEVERRMGEIENICETCAGRWTLREARALGLRRHRAGAPWEELVRVEGSVRRSLLELPRTKAGAVETGCPVSGENLVERCIIPYSCADNPWGHRQIPPVKSSVVVGGSAAVAHGLGCNPRTRHLAHCA